MPTAERCAIEHISAAAANDNDVELMRRIDQSAIARDGDAVFEGPDAAKVLIDARSLRLLDRTVLDYDTSLLSKGFVVNNPHAKSTCGCGSSFSM